MRGADRDGEPQRRLALGRISARARTLELHGGRLRAHVTGEGPPIVFVHGALVNANLWRKVVPRLDGFTRVALDLPLGSHLDADARRARSRRRTSRS